MKILILSLLLVAQVYAQDLPQITKNILPEIKRVGTTGRLNCTVARQKENEVRWFHVDKNVYISTNDDISLEEQFNPLEFGFPKYDVDKYEHSLDLTTYQLIVRRLQLIDSGTYRCYVIIRGVTAQSNPSKDGTMVVLSPPSIIQAETTQTLTVMEGREANLTCNAQGYPTPNITWVRPNGKSIPGHNTFSFKGKNLYIPEVTESDRGVYRCISDNNVKPPETLDATLYVQFKPTAKAVQTSYGQAQNRLFDVVIECRVAGYPEPELRWYQRIEDGLAPIGDDEKHVIHVLLSHGQTLSVAESWYQLTIINVQANDYGEYICEGSNRLGTSRATVVLYETSECQGAWCPQESGIVQGSSSRVVISGFTVFITSLLCYITSHLS